MIVSIPASLRADIKRVCAASPPPADELAYIYLREVYQLWLKWEKAPQRRRIEDFLNQYRAEHLHPRVEHKYGRVIIELTAGEHVSNMMKWKYTTVLRYCHGEKIKASQLIKFIRQKGGINACVELSRRKRQRRDRDRNDGSGNA